MVRYVKVNILVPSQPKLVNGFQAGVTYSGMTLFRTRVAPCGLPANRLLNTQGDARNVPGELIATPFRFYLQLDFTVPIFEVNDGITDTGKFSRSPLSGEPSDTDSRFNQFNEYSVATTGWKLEIGSDNLNAHVNLNLIEDIEFYIAHRSANRFQANCP